MKFQSLSVMRNSMSPNKVVAALLLAVFTLAGCGVKGPPVPPKAAPLPDVALTYRLDGPSVQLMWQMSSLLSNTQDRQATFAIYRSRMDLSEADCDNCPLVFEKVSSRPFVPTEDSRFSSVMALDPGYGYAFKVRLEIGGQAGVDSNTVRFDIPAAEPPSAKETP